MKYMKLGSKPDSFQTDGNNIRYVATDLATDITVIVGDVKFCLHKFPLLSKSGRLQKLASLAEEENNNGISIPDIPGGVKAFEICAKFCYGMTVTLDPYNVISARCASEYLEMHESVDKGNLIYKIDVFLNSSIFRSWKDSIIVLQTTKALLPFSEDLKLVTLCVESISSKASIDPCEVEWSYTYNRKKFALENGVDQSQWNGVKKDISVPKDWWVEDLCDLDIESYRKVIMAIKNKGRSTCYIVGEALKAYTYRRIPGFSKGMINKGDVMRNRAVLETVLLLLPKEKSSVSCSFMIKLLKLARLVNAGENCKKYLVRRIGKQLQEASVSDLLIFSCEGDEIAYDIDLVMNIIQEFLMQENASGPNETRCSEEVEEVVVPIFVPVGYKTAVANLIDGYLVGVSKDPKLTVVKFVELVEMISTSFRPVHDGLYRAIDMYLKEHPDLPKPDKKKLCSLMDCRKLTADATMHAVQNERLPLRLIVQILFFEQLRLQSLSLPSVAPDPDMARSLLPRENGASNGSSASTNTTNTEEDWDRDVVNSIKSVTLVNDKKKGVVSKKLISKLWSSKGQSVENSGSDTSESFNVDEVKSTPSRSVRHSG